MEGTNLTLAVFIPTAVVLVIVLGFYVYFAKWVISLSFSYCLCNQRNFHWMFSLVFCVCFFYSLLRLQGKSVRMPTSSPPYDNMTEESAFDNPIYESGVSTDVMSMQEVDSQNTSVLSWSPSYPLLSFQRHLILLQQRAPSSFITISTIKQIMDSFLYCEMIFLLAFPYVNHLDSCNFLSFYSLLHIQICTGITFILKSVCLTCQRGLRLTR